MKYTRRFETALVSASQLHSDHFRIDVSNGAIGAETAECPRHGWHLAMIMSLARFTNTRKLTEQECLVYRSMTPKRERAWLLDPKRRIRLPIQICSRA